MFDQTALIRPAGGALGYAARAIGADDSTVLATGALVGTLATIASVAMFGDAAPISAAPASGAIVCIVGAIIATVRDRHAAPGKRRRYHLAAPMRAAITRAYDAPDEAPHTRRAAHARTRRAAPRRAPVRYAARLTPGTRIVAWRRIAASFARRVG